ncbi:MULTISPECIES: hypothetical protein [Paraburkholderia]|uniref:hypothetical protein n=1 Tax=Paraburkholderia TaxID=1822464 RepID=UPI0003A83D15|nr:MULTISPECIES: hypothetical protein [Paraburkholderia]
MKTLTGLSPKRNYDNAASLGTVFTTDTVFFDIGANGLQIFAALMESSLTPATFE